MSNLLRDQVLAILANNGGEFHGIFDLAFFQLETQDVSWLRKQLKDLEAKGEIEIINTGIGRGRKKIIKRNRNSPGYARRVR